MANSAKLMAHQEIEMCFDRNFFRFGKYLAVASVILSFGVSGVSWASFAEGEEAYLRNDQWGAFLKFLELAKQGDAASQAMIGRMYVEGLGAPRDLRTAVNFYEKAATQGHAAAQFQLAKMLANGAGVKPDLVQAAQWMEKSAEQGVPWAQLSVGQMYRDGAGVAQDAVQALKWINVAAATAETAQTAETVRLAKVAKTELEASMPIEKVKESQALAASLRASKRTPDTQWQKAIYRPLDVKAPEARPADAKDNSETRLIRDYYPQSR